MSRARKLLVMVGTRKALAIAVKTDRVQRRFTGLKERLARLLGVPGSATFGTVGRDT